jgi:Spy/CpxP family protein refolding chaperone
MKISFLPLFLIGAALTAIPLQSVLADDTAAPDQTAPADGSGGGGHCHKGHFKGLDLTDAQKAQIKQIRATVTDEKERHQQIWAVFTPEQQAKLKAMHHHHHQDGDGDTTSTPAST